MLDFDRTVDAGDILTSITVLLAVLTLVISSSKDRATRIADQANKVRTAAAMTLVRLDRWEALQLSLYQELQPAFVELSEELARRYDVVVVRDQFWKRIGKVRGAIAKQILHEQLGTDYADILTHFPAARSRITAALAKLAEIEAHRTEDFMALSEEQILALQGKQDSYQTPDLGNALREAARTSAAALKQECDSAMASVQAYLFDVIAMRDDRIARIGRHQGSADVIP